MNTLQVDSKKGQFVHHYLVEQYKTQIFVERIELWANVLFVKFYIGENKVCRFVSYKALYKDYETYKPQHFYMVCSKKDDFVKSFTGSNNYNDIDYITKSEREAIKFYKKKQEELKTEIEKIEKENYYNKKKGNNTFRLREKKQSMFVICADCVWDYKLISKAIEEIKNNKDLNKWAESLIKEEARFLDSLQ